MGEALTWIDRSANTLGVVAILLIVVFVIVYGGQRKQQWWVFGWMLSDCEKEKKELDAKLWSYIDRMQNRLDELESLSKKQEEAHRGDQI